MGDFFSLVKKLSGWFFISAVLVFSTGCHTVQKQVLEPNGYGLSETDNIWLKAHFADGDVCIFETWHFDEKTDEVKGPAVCYNYQRTENARGNIIIAIENVSLFETNTILDNSHVLAKTIISGVSLSLTSICLLNPKACFGSCPTFYIPEDDTMKLRAEGFSHSFLPALEDRDVDMLYHFSPQEPRAEIIMKNEALETHVVRHLRLLKTPRPENGRVFSDHKDRFFEVTDLRAPVSCISEDGDCLAWVREFDDLEWSTAAGNEDITEREITELQFDVPAGKSLGLVVAARQTLLTTYFFYEALSLMGEDVGPWLTILETSMESVGHADFRSFSELEVWLKVDDDWEHIGGVDEFGPLASDVHLISIPEQEEERITIRLESIKGAWRIPYISLGITGNELQPEIITPSAVEPIAAGSDHALALITNPDEVLVTLPGEDYRISFDLPADFERYEYFLDSKGYYIEWMRDEWLGESDPIGLMELMINPSQALRNQTREYKKQEPGMEEIFWNSRYERN